MLIAVTGASGNVCSKIVQLCLEEGHLVRAIDVVEPRDATDSDKVSFVKADLTVYENALHALEGADAVIHGAAIPWPLPGKDAIVHNTNVTTSYNVLRACAEHKIHRVTQISSVNAVGLAYNPTVRTYDYLPLDEKHPRTPADCYALSKMICELQADSIVRTFPGMRIASIRPHRSMVQPPSEADDIEPLESQLNVNELWAWSSMRSVATACLLGLTSEGWEGHEAFFIVAPHTRTGQQGSSTSSLELARKYHPKAKLREGWFESEEHKGFYDTNQAERLLGWKHENVPY